MRDAAWLHGRLDYLWDTYFADVEQDNDVRIVWGRKAKTRLGSIRLDAADPTITIITINRLYQDEAIPEYVVDATIVHELTHYAHGFNSPHAQKQAHPHAGGVMAKEFAERGLSDMYKAQKKWLKLNWRTIIEQNFPPPKPRHHRSVPTLRWFT